MTAWNQRVAVYVQELSELAETIDLILDDTRVGNTGVSDKQLNQSNGELQKALSRLEQMVTRRDKLLKAPDAPGEGNTLTEKLNSTLHIEDARLARRCNEVSNAVKLTNERAVALFVCQYHLADLTTDLVKSLTRTTATTTYDREGKSDPNRSKLGGGGLFDKAA